MQPEVRIAAATMPTRGRGMVAARAPARVRLAAATMSLFTPTRRRIDEQQLGHGEELQS
jgi:hypothetical protein